MADLRKTAQELNTIADLQATDIIPVARGSAALATVTADVAKEFYSGDRAQITGENINVTSSNAEDIAVVRYGTTQDTPNIGVDFAAARSSQVYMGSIHTKSQPDVILPQDGVNEFVLNLQSISTQTDVDTPAYQKGPLIAMARCSDNSEITIPKDTVGIQGFGYISEGLTLGRVWSMHLYTFVGTPTGFGDGYALGHEASIENYGSDQPVMDTNTTKITAHLIAAVGMTTTGVYFNAVVGGTYQNAIFTRDAHIAPEAYLIRSEPGFAVKRQGTSYTVAIGHDTPSTNAGTVIHAAPDGGSTSMIMDIEATGGDGFNYINFRQPGGFARSIGTDRVTQDVVIAAGEGLNTTGAPSIARFRRLDDAGTPRRSLHLFSDGTFVTGGDNFLHMPNGVTPTVSSGVAYFALSNQPAVVIPGFGVGRLLVHSGALAVETVTPDRTILAEVGGILVKIPCFQV